MTRFNFYVEQETLDKLEEAKSEYGHSTISGFMRYIMNDFLKKNS